MRASEEWRHKPEEMSRLFTAEEVAEFLGSVMGMLGTGESEPKGLL